MCVGFPEWTAHLSVWKATGKDSYEAGAIACQNCAVYSVFPSGMTSHSKIVHFYVLLTVHLSIILIINQRNAQIFVL